MSGHYWEAPGLSAIQFQLSVALARRANNDEVGCFDALKDLAVLTESAEIITLAEKFEKETENTLAVLRCRTHLNPIDAHNVALEVDHYLKARNYDFLKLIIMEAGRRGITLRVQRLVSGKEFGEIEETEDKDETEEQQ